MVPRVERHTVDVTPANGPALLHGRFDAVVAVGAKRLKIVPVVRPTVPLCLDVIDHRGQCRPALLLAETAQRLVPEHAQPQLAPLPIIASGR